MRVVFQLPLSGSHEFWVRELTVKEYSAFNSLSRDHMESARRASEELDTSFNSLSRDHPGLLGARLGPWGDLSTPSLGITRRNSLLCSRVGSFQLPLSGSHALECCQTQQFIFIFQLPLSGSLRSCNISSDGSFAILSTPSLGITRRQGHRRGAPRGSFNSLSRDHFAQGLLLKAKIVKRLSTPSLGITTRDGIGT